MGRGWRSLHARYKAAQFLIVSLLISGCSATTESPYPTISASVTAQPSSISPSNKEYQEALDRIKESEALEKQLQENNRTENLENSLEDAKEISNEQDQEITPSIKISIAQNAYAEVMKWKDGSVVASPNSVIASPNVSEELKLKSLAALSNAFSMWDEVLDVPSQYKVFIFTASDSSWIEEQMVGYRIGHAGYSTWTDYTNNVCNKYAAGASSPEAFVFCFPEESATYVGNIEALVTHEYFHSVQRKLDGGGNKSPGWIDEGTADYVDIVARKSQDSNQKISYCGTQGSDYFKETYGYFKISDLANHWSVDQLATIYKELESNTGNQSHLQVYCMGSLAAHYIIGNHGGQALINYYKEIGNGIPWRQAFQNNFKTSIDDFYQNMLKYLQDIY